MAHLDNQSLSWPTKYKFTQLTASYKPFTYLRNAFSLLTDDMKYHTEHVRTAKKKKEFFK